MPARQHIARRLLTPLALVATLAAGLLVAGVMVNHRRQSLLVRFDAGREIGDATLRFSADLPHGWKEARNPGGIVLNRAEGAGRLIVLRGRMREFISPLQALRGFDMVRGEPLVKSMMVGGWPGILAHSEQRGRSGAEARLISAAAVLPSRDAFVVSLEAVGAADDADEKLVKRVAASIHAGDIKPPAPAPTEPQLGNCAVRLDGRWLTSPADDPYRHGLAAVSEQDEGWLGIELVPCTVLPEDGPEALATMIACRDQNPTPAREATTRPTTDASRPVLAEYEVRIEAIGPNTHGGLRARREVGKVNAVTWVIADDAGSALLVEMRSDGRDVSRMEQVWRTLAGSIRFGSPDVEQRLARGAEAVRQLAAGGEWFKKAPEKPERWRWVAYDDSSSPPQVRAEVEAARDVHALAVQERIALAGPDAPRVQLLRHSVVSDDLRGYRCESAVAEGGLLCSMAINPDEFHLEMTSKSGHSPPRRAIFVRPPQFVPGALLPDLLAQANTLPAIVRTDFTPLVVAPSLPGLVTLEIESSTAAPRYQDDDGEPLRCLAVRISGSSEVTHWHFSPEGKLLYIDLAAGRHLKREEMP